MIKKNILFLALFILLSSVNYAASITLVCQNIDKKAISEVDIFTYPSDLKYTQEKNAFIFEKLPPGEYTFYLMTELHITQTLIIEITETNQSITQEVIFLPETISLDTLEIKHIKHLHAGEVEDDHLIATKKNTIIELDDLDANKSTNNANQIFAKTPLTNIVVIDGAGIQLGIGGRGLDPHRSANFNIRQNGYDISADALGYPESYYTPPAEALEKIEILQGAASLQYGTQFGGVVNFKMRSHYDKPFEFRTRQTIGSFGLFNSFNSVGGKTKNGIKYFAYYQRKSGKDYRPNANFELNNLYGHIEIPLGKKIFVGIDQTYMNYLAQQPGGLTDNEFEENARQSNRERNWFEVKWYIPSLAISYFPRKNLMITNKTFGLHASRNSVGNLGPIDRIDDPNSKRDVILGTFKNIGNETRSIYSYFINNHQAYLSSGFRIYYAKNITTQGVGSAASNADFNLADTSDITSDFLFPNRNLAFFAENLFHVTKRLSITPGFRFEHIKTSSEGFYRTKSTDLAGNTLQNYLTYETLDLPRNFLIFGIGSSYKLVDSVKTCEIYSNFSQNYRSVTYSDIRINNPSLLVDSSINDERGFNMDLGIRAENPTFFDFDASIFLLHYDDRIGEVLQRVPDPVLISTTKRYRSNISDAIIYGFEFFGEYNIFKLWNDSTNNSLNLFGNVAVLRSKYINSDDPNIEGNQIEYAPNFNFKTGLRYKRKKISTTIQSSYTSQQYSDASNADDHPSAFVGIIPSYFILDWSFGWQLNKSFKLESGVNNLTNTQYFTKRATGYPGPGILPAIGRNFYFTLEIKI